MTPKQTPPYAPGLTQHHITLTVDARSIARAAAALDEATDKVRLQIQEDAIRAETIAKNNTSATRITIDSFEWVTDVCETDVGIETSELRRAVGSRVDDDVVDVTVTSKPDEPGCEIVVSSGDTMNWVEAFSPDDVLERESFTDLIDWEYDTSVMVPSRKFKGAIGAVSEASGKTVRVTAMDDSLLFEGDLKYAPEEFTGPSSRIDTCAIVDGPDAEQVFSPGLMRDIADVLPSEGIVTLHMKENIPVHIEHGSGIEFVAAPSVLPGGQE